MVLLARAGFAPQSEEMCGTIPATEMWLRPHFPLGRGGTFMAELPRVHVARWLSHERLANGVLFMAQSDAGDPVQIEITLPEPAVMRLRLAPGALCPPNNRLLVPGREPVTGSTLGVDQDSLTLSSPQLRISVEREPWRVTLVDPTDRDVVAEATDDRDILGHFEVSPLGWDTGESGKVLRVFEALSLAPEERMYGFGERFVPIDQRGRRWESWTTDALSTATQRAYKPVPFGLSSRGYGLFVNSTARIEFDLGATSALSAAFTVDATELDYFIIYGPAFNDVLRRYWRLTGAPPLPPLWSFGFWTSRSGYQSRQEVEQIARSYRQRSIPCDVIHLDPQWMGAQENWCNLSWDTAAFPEPAEMIENLRREGFRVCLWENPYVPRGSDLYAEGAERGCFVQDAQDEPYLIPGWTDAGTPTAVVDFTNPAAITWWQERHRQLLAMGVAVFKTDFGEAAPVEGRYHDGTPGREAHNLYPLLYNQAVFEQVDAQGDGQGLVWSRSTAAGGQRFPVHWGGDSRPTFEHMAATLRGGLNFVLSGFAYWSHDIGGFSGTTNPELYARWAQFGLFCSHARAHGTTEREPWVFGEETERIFRTYATLRYRLLPYLYSCAARTVSTGRPLLRPLLLDYQDDPNTHALDLQYLFGDDFLVAPVCADTEDVLVYLPEGRWVDYWSKVTHAGPGWFTVHAPLDTLPLFVREGAMIPMGPPTQFVEEKSLDPLTLDVYPADEGAFSLLDERIGPVEMRYRLEREGINLYLDGYHGGVEAQVNLVPSPWDVRVNGLKIDEWEMHERYVLVRFFADGPTELSMKFDL
jgi:alpha-D-xyloside xylohydrolase